MAYSKYTVDEQVDFIAADLLVDIEHAEPQALNGPFFPEKGITADSLRAYARDCRAQLARLHAYSNHSSQLINAFIAGKL